MQPEKTSKLMQIKNLSKSVWLNSKCNLKERRIQNVQLINTSPTWLSARHVGNRKSFMVFREIRRNTEIIH